MDKKPYFATSAIGAALGLLIIVVFAFICNVTVPAGFTGVVTNWGELKDWTYDEGYHWTAPTYTIHEMSLQTQTYDMSGENGIHALSKDQLQVGMDVTVQFHLARPAAVAVYRYYSLAYADNVVHPLVRSIVRDAASEFTAIELVDQRDNFQNHMNELVVENLRRTLRERGVPENAIVVENILLRNLDLPDSIEESIANVMRQRQITTQRGIELETARAEAARATTEAEGAAAVARAQAQGEADATRIRAQGQAESNQIIAASTTPTILRLREIESFRAVLENEHTRVVVVPMTERGGQMFLQIPSTN